MKTPDAHTIDVCTDCLLLLANGEIGEGPRTAEEVGLAISEIWAGWDISIGRMKSEDVVAEIHTAGGQPHSPCVYLAPPQVLALIPEDFLTLALEDQLAAQLWDGWALCSCEDTAEGWFSWSSCEGCGSGLGGDRHYATAWRVEDPGEPQIRRRPGDTAGQDEIDQKVWADHQKSTQTARNEEI